MALKEFKANAAETLVAMKKAGKTGRLLILSAGGSTPVDTKSFPIGKWTKVRADLNHSSNKFSSITISKDGPNKGKAMPVSVIALIADGKDKAVPTPLSFKDGLLMLALGKDASLYIKPRALENSTTIVVDVAFDSKGTVMFSLPAEFEANLIDEFEPEMMADVLSMVKETATKTLNAAKKSGALVNSEGEEEDEE